MQYRVLLEYYRPTGRILATVETLLEGDEPIEIWAAVHELRRLGRLPGLVPGSGRDLFIIVDIPDDTRAKKHLVMPPFMDEGDITPPRQVPTGEMIPLVRVGGTELPRTSTRDIIKVDPEPSPPAASEETDSDDAITPVDVPIPRPPEKP